MLKKIRDFIKLVGIAFLIPVSFVLRPLIGEKPGQGPVWCPRCGLEFIGHVKPHDCPAEPEKWHWVRGKGWQLKDPHS